MKLQFRDSISKVSRKKRFYIEKFIEQFSVSNKKKLKLKE